MTVAKKRARRGNHEGGLRWREDRQKYEAQISVGGQRISKSFATHKEGVVWLSNMRTQSQKGKIQLMTLEQFLRFWLENHKDNITDSTYKGYERSIRLHIPHKFGQMRLVDILPEDMFEMFWELDRRGIGARAYNITRTLINKAYKDARNWGGPTVNPVYGIRRKRIQRKEITVLSAAQAQRLLAEINGHELDMPVSLGLHTGMRIGEVLGLMWKDIDYDTKTLTVRRQALRKTRGGIQFKPPKSKSSTRRITLNEQLIKKLRAQQDWIEEYKAYLKEADREDEWQDFDLVCPSRVGTPLDKCNLNKRFQALLAEIGLPKCTFHTLRHTHATLLMLKNISPKVVSERLGHADIKITLEIYSHVLPTMQDKAAEAVDELFSNKPKKKGK